MSPLTTELPNYIIKPIGEACWVPEDPLGHFWKASQITLCQVSASFRSCSVKTQRQLLQQWKQQVPVTLQHLPRAGLHGGDVPQHDAQHGLLQREEWTGVKSRWLKIPNKTMFELNMWRWTTPILVLWKLSAFLGSPSNIYWGIFENVEVVLQRHFLPISFVPKPKFWKATEIPILLKIFKDITMYLGWLGPLTRRHSSRRQWIC